MATIAPQQRLIDREALASADDAELLARFVRDQDEGAFQALVRRHGPMVLGVCRRVLGNAHDAEDAFQATFLVLAKKAGAVRRPGLLANWLYGVASRVARKAKASAARRQARLPRVAPLCAAPPTLELAWREVHQALDEELSRLGNKLRAPLVLCYLEGKTHEEAARLLGRPLGSMSWLLARGLAALRARLTDRGLSLPSAVPALLLLLGRANEVPGWLVDATVKIASLGAAGAALAGGVSAPAAAAELAEAGWGGLVSWRPLRAAVLALALLLLGGAALFALQAPEQANRGPHPTFPLGTPGGGGRCCKKRKAEALLERGPTGPAVKGSSQPAAQPRQPAPK